ncbi:MAG: beta-lactamase family protein, partial [Acidobacteria bacterium]|nr:beta-lactamase family protein [Acidobacteriota bacterium]
EGFGFADLERKNPATSDSIYILASVSKPITTTGLMILKDQGLIDLDAPLNRYLPGEKLRSYAGAADGMTVRRVANHSSGLPLHYTFFYDGIVPHSMDEAIRRYGFAATEPGREWNYSNLGFGVLNYLTEVVSRTPWSRFMEEKLYDPLGMSRTSDRVRKGRESDATAIYSPDVNGKFIKVTPYTFDHPGASQIHSTANDLARWVRMHLNGGVLDGTRILKPETAREMQVMTSKRPDGSGTGIGWGVGEFYGRRCISHSGGMPGVATWVRMYPDEGMASIVLTNTDRRTMADEVTGKIAAVFFPEGKPPARTEPPKPENDPARFLGVWKGRLVHFDGDVPLSIEVKGRNEVTIKLGSVTQDATGITFDKDRFTARINALIRTQPSYHGEPAVDFRLRLDGDRLLGTGVALASGYFALSHWVELAKSQ